MASPSSIREFRFRVGTTFNTTHANAANATHWGANATDVTKMRLVAFDDTGLVQDGLASEELITRLYGRPAPYPGLRVGSMKFSAYLCGAESNVDDSPEATLLSKMMGGIQAPTNARSAVVGASAEMTSVNAALGSANTYCSAGMGVLVGVKGDGRGAGEVKIVSSVDSEAIQFTSVCSGTPIATDALVFSTTIYLDQTATQNYFDTLAIGHATDDQRQTIGGAGTFGISGTGPGELPKIDVDLTVADHQYAPTGSRSSLAHGTDPDGNDPAHDRAIGMFQLGDTDSTTRAVYAGGDFAVSPNVTVEGHPDLNGVNGIGGFQAMPGAPTLEATLLMDEDTEGLVSDFEDRTDKSVVLQYGHTATKCAAVEMPLCHLTALPVPATINNLSGVKISLEAQDDYTSDGELQSSPLRIHLF